MTHASAASTHTAERTPADRQDLDRSLVSGFVWTGASKWGSQILSWLATLAVARILVPADFGLIGMASVYLGLIQLVNQFGLGAAILQKRDLQTSEIARLGGFSVLLAVCLYAGSLLLAAPVGRFFHEPAIAPIVRVLSVTFLSGALEVIPRTLLTRELHFRRLALVDGLAALAATAGTLGLALIGLGYWALVFGNVAGRITSTATVLYLRPHRLAWPWEFRKLRGPLGFGAQVVVANIAWYAYRNADLAVIGRLLGKMALGVYDIGITVASTPIERLNELTGRVVPAVFAAVQHDLPAVRRYFLRLTEGIALVTFPAAAGVALVAPDFVRLALGAKWEGAIVPLRILALAAAFRSLGPLLSHVLVYTGHPSRNTQYTITAALILPPLFLLGAKWGLAGVAAVWLIVQPVISLATAYRHAFRFIDLSASAYLRALWPAISGVVVMSATVLGLQASTLPTMPLAPRFALEVLAGTVVYAAVLYALYRERLLAFWQVVARLRSERAAARA